MTKKSDIAELIKKVKNYDRIAQKQLYLRYADGLMSIAIRYAKDQSGAKDLVHDTFIKVFNRIDSYKEEKGLFKAWISRVLVNTAIERFRKDRRVFFPEDDLFFEKPSTEVSALEYLKAEDILQLLKQLPEGAQAVFNLHVIEGYKHEEIGKLMNISASTSRSQLTRAKHILRKLIIEQNDQSDLCPGLKTG